MPPQRRELFNGLVQVAADTFQHGIINIINGKIKKQLCAYIVNGTKNETLDNSVFPIIHSYIADSGRFT